MNEFKAQSCIGIYKSEYREDMTNRERKRYARRQARHSLNNKSFLKILIEEIEKNT